MLVDGWEPKCGAARGGHGGEEVGASSAELSLHRKLQAECKRFQAKVKYVTIAVTEKAARTAMHRHSALVSNLHSKSASPAE